MSRQPKTSAKTRFIQKVDKVSSHYGCWLWLGCLDGKGYGVFHIATGQRDAAHRYSWSVRYGPIPAGMCVLHNCPGGDNPRCVNPKHLWLGTHAQNMADMAAKGRSGMRRHPERAARGLQNGNYTHPERRPRGDRHGSKTQPHRVARGDRNGGAKLTNEDVKEIRVRHARGEMQIDLAHEYGLHRCSIYRIVSRNFWKCVV